MNMCTCLTGVGSLPGDGKPAEVIGDLAEVSAGANHLRIAGTAPVLLLDDVFSELDPDRSAALLVNLPPGQTILTSASGHPEGAHPELVLRVRDGAVSRSA